jgi:hypothetical protein
MEGYYTAWTAPVPPESAKQPIDVRTCEATHKAEYPADVEEVCNYVEALAFAHASLARRTSV